MLQILLLVLQILLLVLHKLDDAAAVSRNLLAAAAAQLNVCYRPGFAPHAKTTATILMLAAIVHSHSPSQCQALAHSTYLAVVMAHNSRHLLHPARLIQPHPSCLQRSLPLV